MAHIHTLRHAHRALVKRLEAGTAALPEPSSDRARKGWQEILEILFSPEDAVLAGRMPVKPAHLEQLAVKFNIRKDVLKVRLDSMCERGLIIDLINPGTGQTVYFLAPPVVGFIEFSLMRAHDGLPKKRLAEAFEAYAHGDDTFFREVFGKETFIGRTLVHETALQDEALPEVLDWERATAIIEQASAVAVSLCYCRHKNAHLGKACDAPLENCLSVNSGADFVTRRNFGRAIEKAEALDILKASREGGLVQIADNVVEQPAYICNCCGCCCGQLEAMNTYSLITVTPSGFIASCSPELCAGCSRCSRACPVTAITMTAHRADAQRTNNLLPAVKEELCIGCGICADTCTTGGIAMVRRTTQPRVPQNSIEKTVRMMLERGRLPDLLFDQGASRTHYFMNRILAALCSLPPVDRALASEQLRSRFVRFALARFQDATRS